MNSPPANRSEPSAKLSAVGLLAMLFVSGFVLMGFEMLGSRYLNPYFGGGITTWACLISVVLLAMMVGYMSGGVAADRQLGTSPLAWILLLAGAILIVVAYGADPAMEAILSGIGDGFWGVLIAASALVFVPVALLSACSPYVVRLILTELQYGGRVTGTVYGVSTAGNIVGTLATTFWLIPAIGTRSITKVFAIILIVLAVTVFAHKRLRQIFFRLAIAALLVSLPIASLDNTARAQPDVVRLKALYPEGPLWVGDRLLFAEMTADRIIEYADNVTSVFWQQPGCGPTAITTYQTGNFAVNCHSAGQVVILDEHGKLLDRIKRSSDAAELRNPNDINADGRGGVFLSDPGPFAPSFNPSGIVYRIDAAGELSAVHTGLKYPNGIAYAPKTRVLYVSEHLRQQVWAFSLSEKFAVLDARVILTREQLFTSPPPSTSLIGPDGLRLDARGNLYVALYGAGRIAVLSTDGTVRSVKVPVKYVTSIAISKDLIAVTGAYSNASSPYPGEVVIVNAGLFEHAESIGF